MQNMILKMSTKNGKKLDLMTRFMRLLIMRMDRAIRKKTKNGSGGSLKKWISRLKKKSLNRNHIFIALK